MILDSAAEGSVFYGNKIRLLKKPDDTAWYDSYLKIVKYLPG